MRYGLPYQGSKSKIADFVVANLPKADTLVDLFCGGCAITHGALLSGKYNHIIINDLLPDIPQLFVDAINGKYRNETRWISRADFNRLKDTDAYVRLVWSYGNNQESYLYAKWVEPWKKALHYARVMKREVELTTMAATPNGLQPIGSHIELVADTTLLKNMGIDSDGSRLDIKAHSDEYKQKYIEWYKRKYKKDCGDIGRMCDLQRIESLQSLQSIERILTISTKDYREVAIPKGAVVYCDPPYRGTKGYACRGGRTKFDHDVFWQWAKEQDELLVISEYYAPDDFVCVAEIGRRSLFGTEKRGRVTEKLFVHQSKVDEYHKRMSQHGQQRIDF